MKDYIAICYATKRGADPQDGKILGFEFEAKNFKTAQSKAEAMFSKTEYDSATWVGTSRLKYNSTRDDFELADQKISDMLIGVEEWIVDSGGDLKDINLQASVPKLDEIVPPPKQLTAPKKGTKKPKEGTTTSYVAPVFPITADVIRAARSYSHIEYTSEERKEVFK